MKEKEAVRFRDNRLLKTRGMNPLSAVWYEFSIRWFGPTAFHHKRSLDQHLPCSGDKPQGQT